VILNELEAAVVAGIAGLDPADVGEVARIAQRLQTHPSQVVLITLGDRGVVAVSNSVSHHVPARRVQAVDTTGAGDCFTGAFAVRWAAGDRLLDALQYATVAASLCVQTMGAAPSLPTAAAVAAVL
jgi:ribokinase